MTTERTWPHWFTGPDGERVLCETPADADRLGPGWKGRDVSDPEADAIETAAERIAQLDHDLAAANGKVGSLTAENKKLKAENKKLKAELKLALEAAVKPADPEPTKP